MKNNNLFNGKTTCLLIGPNVKENPYGSDNWKSGDIKISSKLINFLNTEMA